MARFCTSCGGEFPEGAAACPKCGAGTAPTVIPPASAQGGLADNVAGLLAYITIIPAIVFLLIEPFNKNRFVRFHSFQCLFIAVASFAIGIVFMILSMIPVIGLLLIPVSFIIWVGIFVLVVVCMIKAYQGQKWKLPVIGDLAEKQADSV
jgi:uncharacterized membrane protein